MCIRDRVVATLRTSLRIAMCLLCKSQKPKVRTMLRKKKNKHPLPQGEVNVTSLMDIMTTLLFFILMVLSFNKITIIDAFAPQAGAVSEDKKKVFALKVSYVESGKVDIDLGPLDELKMVDESKLLS